MIGEFRSSVFAFLRALKTLYPIGIDVLFDRIEPFAMIIIIIIIQIIIIIIIIIILLLIILMVLYNVTVILK